MQVFSLIPGTKSLNLGDQPADSKTILKWDHSS